MEGIHTGISRFLLKTSHLNMSSRFTNFRLVYTSKPKPAELVRCPRLKGRKKYTIRPKAPIASCSFVRVFFFFFFFSLFQTRTDCTSPTGAPYAERKQLLKGKIPRLFFWELRLSSSFTLPVGGAARVFILVLKARAQTPFFLLVLPKRPPPLLTVRG